MRIDWQIAVVIKQHVKLDRSLSLPVLGLVEHLQTKLDDGCVQTEKLVLEAQALPGCRGPRYLQHCIEERFILLPRSMGVCVG